MRRQYHLKKSENGFDAWDVHELIAATKDFTVFEIDLSDVIEFHENYWYQDEEGIPTCVSIVEHMKLVMDCDLSYPIILAADGSLMDGMHRVCKSHLNGLTKINAVQFIETPDPDFIDVGPEDLTY